MRVRYRLGPGPLRNQVAWRTRPAVHGSERAAIPDGYVVRDANKQALVYLYFRDNEAEALQAKVLTKDEARRIAVNVARLPDLLGKGDRD
jgi:predicted secreted protein